MCLSEAKGMDINMARSNQGVFKAIRKKVEELEKDYWNIKNTYFDNNGWNAKYDFFTDFAYLAESFYNETNSAMFEIIALLNSTKFENPRKTMEYQEFIKMLDCMKQDIWYKFHETLNLIRIGSGISEAEKETIDNMNILKLLESAPQKYI